MSFLWGLPRVHRPCSPSDHNGAQRVHFDSREESQLSTAAQASFAGAAVSLPHADKNGPPASKLSVWSSLPGEKVLTLREVIGELSFSSQGLGCRRVRQQLLCSSPGGNTNLSNPRQGVFFFSFCFSIPKLILNTNRSRKIKSFR